MRLVSFNVVSGSEHIRRWSFYTIYEVGGRHVVTRRDRSVVGWYSSSLSGMLDGQRAIYLATLRTKGDLSWSSVYSCEHFKVVNPSEDGYAGSEKIDVEVDDA